MTVPSPPPSWRPHREPGERRTQGALPEETSSWSDQAAIDRYEDAINEPNDDDAPRSWEP